MLSLVYITNSLFSTAQMHWLTAAGVWALAVPQPLIRDTKVVSLADTTASLHTPAHLPLPTDEQETSQQLYIVQRDLWAPNAPNVPRVRRQPTASPANLTTSLSIIVNVFMD